MAPAQIIVKRPNPNARWASPWLSRHLPSNHLPSAAIEYLREIALINGNGEWIVEAPRREAGRDLGDILWKQLAQIDGIGEQKISRLLGFWKGERWASQVAVLAADRSALKDTLFPTIEFALAGWHDAIELVENSPETLLEWDASRNMMRASLLKPGDPVKRVPIFTKEDIRNLRLQIIKWESEKKNQLAPTS